MSTHRRLVSESTPLLPTPHSSADQNGPAVLPVVQSLSLTDLSTANCEDFTPASFELDHCRRLAFALVVILQLRKQKIAHRERNSDIYEKWTNEEARCRDVEILEEKVNDIWEEFLTQYHSPQELYDILWTEFPLTQDTSSMTKVVNFLTSKDAPQKFVAHPIIFMTMTRAWRFGRPDSNQSENRFLSMRKFCTSPSSKIHFLELLLDLASVVTLISYVMRPPNWPDSDNSSQNPPAAYPYTLREAYLMLYAFSILLSARGVNTTLSALTLAAFAPSLPSLPLPGSAGFGILLWVIFVRILAYHITTVFPNPLFLISHQRSFPLALFLANGLGRIIRPLFLFYLPVMLVACFALSISLSGPITGPLMYSRSFQAFIIPSVPDPLIIGAAPMDTRMVFFLLSVTVLLFVLASAFILATSTPIASKHSTVFHASSTLDSYSPEIGHLARVISYHATATYSVDYYFPPPFKIFELFLVIIPVSLIRIFGHSQFNRAVIASRVWYITVQPFLIIITPFWLLLA
ncbi:hypothetical protein AGABI2DRAFT_114242 [Agaricus bisporus var. bisporus H97]|uniref:hypothetical protein n=1 Tax=Agaricus bisporus var. bisporus (strain H97 / ATCC MYA-4626 / FGSC 10389) TaxID=936046 RepID=UPI00029F7C17|nr:hypothetical protein AGABI2DRAFT_114242 [Agaricus bisporus var. bisporus H97]EKV51506.1 hypothetical protein AGABI2DRAFT_114242 [Agaricus bisporus var. bisporus H97]